MELAEKCYTMLTEGGVKALLDDRDVWPGVKFADADLLGIPTQIILGRRSVSEGKIELVNRKTRKKRFMPIDVAAEALVAAVR